MIAACYSMDLYCDNAKPDYAQDRLLHVHQEFPHQYTGETFRECKREAVKSGWKFTRDGKHYCPKCKGQKP